MNEEASLIHQEIEAISDKLCVAVKGEFDFTVEVHNPDESLQKLSMLINFVLDAARRSLADIKEKNTKLTELDKLKSDFLANVSHELRTPLTLILGPLDSILSDSTLRLSDERRQDLLRIQRNANRLYLLVNDLLDFSKAEAGKHKVHEEVININAVISEIIDDAQGLAIDRKLALEYLGCPTLNSVLFDRKMLGKIVLNLVSNAIKFTPQGGKVTVQLIQDADAIQLIVKDNGIGIPQDQLQHIFQRFHQIDSSRTRAYEGTGIGLALIQEFITLMGGSIQAESQEGKGSTFSVKLPLHIPDAAQLSQFELEKSITADEKILLLPRREANRVAPVKPKIEGKFPLILVVDDNEDICSHMSSLLSDSYELITASNGNLALEAIYQHHPSIVLSDVMMPVMDGYELTRKIKDDPAIKDTPVILVTAEARKEAVLVATGALADDYLPKPFSVEQLRARIIVALRNVQLKEINKKLSAEIDARKKAEEEAAELNSRLVMVARRAGMSDLATSILHNVGNILNSANISVRLLLENLDKKDCEKLIKISDMFKEHATDLTDFLTNDSRGKLLPKYLNSLAKVIAEDRHKDEVETQNLATHIKHIESIVSMQKALSGINGVTEKFFVPEVIEDAFKICGEKLANMNIEVKKEFKDAPFIVSDKSKVLQILVNLIQNAKDAFLFSDYEFPKKIISVSVHQTESKDPIKNSAINIEVSDNGIGVVPENLIKIFTFGFTTKPTGHGFGLHSSAISAKELGGALLAKSEGVGLGTTFSLTLPQNRN